jgi:O-antigen/teichoic acid export membrane protein
MASPVKVGRNALYLTGASLAGTAIAVAFNVYLARHLGVDRFGEFAFGISFITLLATIVEFSLHTFTVREVVRNPEKAAKYFGGSLCLKCLLFVVTLGIAAVITGRLNYSHGTRLLLAVLIVSLLFDGIRKCCDSLFTAVEQMHYPAIMAVAEKAIVATFGFLALLLWDTVIAVAFAYIVAHGITQLGSLALVRLKLGVKPERANWEFVKHLAKGAFPFFGISLIAAIYANIDRLFLFSIGGTAAVGIYAAAYRLVALPLHFSSSFHQAIFPSLSKHAALQETGRLPEIVESSVRYLTLGAVPVAIGITALSEPIMTFVYGPAYASGSVALQILVWAYALEFFNPFFSRVLFVLEKQRLVLIAAIAGTLMNVAVNVVLIPLYGFVGAAVATLVAAAVIFMLLASAVHRIFPAVSIRLFALKVATSGAGMWVSLCMLEAAPLFLRVLLGGAVYFLTLFLIRTLSAAEYTMISRIFRITAPVERH